MKMFTRILGIVMALMMCLAPVLSHAEDAAADPNEVLVLVNGTPVTREDFDLYLYSLQNYYSQYGYDVTEAGIAAQLNVIALETAIQYAILDQQAITMGVDQISDDEMAQVKAEVASQWEEIVNLYMEYYGGVTAESTEQEIADARVSILALLESMGYTEEVLLEDALAGAKYDRVEAEMVKDVVVTEDEITAEFNTRVSEDQSAYENDIGTYEYMTQYYGQTAYFTPAGYRGVTHILLDVDAALLETYENLQARLEESLDEAESEEAVSGTDVPENVVTQADVDAAYDAIIASVQPTIDTIMDQFNNGTPFADLIAIYNTDPGMNDPDTLQNGYPVHLDSIMWDPAFVKGAFSVTEVGQVSEPVVGMYGVHLIHYTRDIPSGAVEMTTEVRNTLYAELLATKENDVFVEKMTAWMKEASLVYSDAAMALLPEDYVMPADRTEE